MNKFFGKPVVSEGIVLNTLPPRRSMPAMVEELQKHDDTSAICESVHPDYTASEADWEKWRLTYQGGQEFLEKYLMRYTRREEIEDFNDRKEITPIPGFAKSAVNDIKNSIYQRVIDVTRKGGPDTYLKSVEGKLNGVDRKRGTMNWFIGNYILPELLTMSKVGVFVDMPVLPGQTLADKGDLHPYCYIYKAEDIRNWAKDENDEFSNLLLRDYRYIIDPRTKLPAGETCIFRHFYKDENGFVVVDFYNEDDEKIDSIQLNIKTIPFVVFEISHSLLEDVCNHQIALMNVESSDIAYILKSNFPFYTEQYDSKTENTYLKSITSTEEGETEDSTPTNAANEIKVGTTHGRRYPIGAERPGFIAPPTEPLQASMQKQQRMKEDIRSLVNLALSNIKPKQASAESKSLDQQGLEAGLSYIGLVLERGENVIGTLWSIYEGAKVFPTVIYPKRYHLKSDEELRKEAEQYEKMVHKVPSKTYKKEILKILANLLVGSKVSNEDLEKIQKEIDVADYISSDAENVHADVENGLLSNKTAARIRGYSEDEPDKAAKDHAARLKRIQDSQTSPEDRAGARGLKDSSGNPSSGREEKKESRETVSDPVVSDKTRGEGQ